jgi:hypothetical protein
MMLATSSDSSGAPDHAEPRGNAQLLRRLETLILQMDSLGIQGEDAAARVTAAIPHLGGDIKDELVTALGDVIEIITERSRLAHEAHRVMTEIRRTEFDRRATGGADRG